MEDKLKVTLCLGSSCFSKKNRDVVSALQEYVLNKSLQSKVHLKGGHCFGHCKRGPLMLVNDQEFTEITPRKAIAIIESFLIDE